VPEKLSELLDEYIKKYNLIDKKLIGMRNNDFSEKIKNIFLQETNKGATVNTIRHSYINYMSENKKIETTEEKKILSSMMAHSHITQQDVYKKKI
jgi:hypothetical protein